MLQANKWIRCVTCNAKRNEQDEIPDDFSRATTSSPKDLDLNAKKKDKDKLRLLLTLFTFKQEPHLCVIEFHNYFFPA